MKFLFITLLTLAYASVRCPERSIKWSSIVIESEGVIPHNFESLDIIVTPNQDIYLMYYSNYQSWVSKWNSAGALMWKFVKIMMEFKERSMSVSLDSKISFATENSEIYVIDENKFTGDKINPVL